MKKVKFIFRKYGFISLLLIAFSSFGQVSCFDNNPIWTIQFSNSYQYPCLEYNDFNYYIKGDTNIGNFNYKKVFKKGIGYYQWFSGGTIPPYCQGTYYFYDTLNPVAFIRDTLNQIHFWNNSNDELLYDFNLNVGDTIVYNSIMGMDTFVVVKIDSILISTKYRKKYELSSTMTSNEFLIEGIGSSFGLLEPMGLFLDYNYRLICFGLNDTTYYTDYPFTGPSCDINVEIDEIKNQQYDIKVFPNPTDDYINIISTLPINSINVYNCYKQNVLYCEYNNNDTNLKLNIHPLVRGVYLIEIITKNADKSVFRKIIKL